MSFLKLKLFSPLFIREQYRLCSFVNPFYFWTLALGQIYLHDHYFDHWWQLFDGFPTSPHLCFYFSTSSLLWSRLPEQFSCYSGSLIHNWNFPFRLPTLRSVVRSILNPWYLVTAWGDVSLYSSSKHLPQVLFIKSSPRRRLLRPFKFPSV
jgi:hypothetical protein